MARNRAFRERRGSELARKKGKRPAHDRILIVTEGSKTEPHYFNEIRKELRISQVHLLCVGAPGTQPLKVVTGAAELFEETKGFEQVYAVFDRDSHDLGNYKSALSKAQALDGKLKSDEKGKVSFKAVPSVPCFEFWLLLHFERVERYEERKWVFDRLKQHLPRYEKGNQNTYADTHAHLTEAVQRADRLRQIYKPDSGTEPYTDVDVLVQTLLSLQT